MTGREDTTIVTRTAALLAALGGRAAGCWRIQGDELCQVAFVPAPTLPEAVARDFAAATRSVPLDRIDLGIVEAAVSGIVKTSRAAELSAEAGSGFWLRAFGATRSVAVPVLDAAGRVRGIVSVALAGDLSDEAVAERIRDGTQDWPI